MRGFLALAIVLIQSAALVTSADEPFVRATLPADSAGYEGDAFSAALQQLQERVEALEAENAELKQVADQPPQPSTPTLSDGGIDELRNLSVETSQRLNDLQLKLQEEAEAEAAAAKKKKEEDAKKDKKWFEKYSIRGYAQFRISDVTRDDGLGDPQLPGDSSVGDRQGFLIRRARLILSGDISEHVSLYFQPDFAVNVPGSVDQNQYTQIRDLYADVHIDKEKEFRFRVGQSKVPYGWENLQSSSNRLPLDRNDALNSAVRNERDLGLMFYWTPKEVQDIFKFINDNGLKGSGNYGLFGVGLYNGQGGSLREQNDNLHAVARFALPFYVNDSQLAEVGIQGYTGRYTVPSASISPLGVGPLIRPVGTLENGGAAGLEDERVAWTFVYYPQPLGFQSEWTVGRGPALNADQTALEERSLYGGYAMVMYREQLTKGELLPFARWNYFQGGYKSERNAPWSEIQEWELGVEWQLSKALEIVALYTLTDRTNTQANSTAGTQSYNQFDGEFVRCQVQVTY
ncbi:MAG: hypothetical protein RLZZ232_1918 [Planctomycetota bacterium]|jgi:hypothetical protein